MWIFLIISTLAWGIAEILYKKGSLANEKYSHLKIAFFVGLFMGIHAIATLLIKQIDLKTFPTNFIRYLPVAACYIVSMVCSYFGVRFLEESISDPIENTSAAIVPILCAIFLKEKFSPLVIVGIAVVGIGLFCISFLDKTGKKNRNKKFGKKLAVFALAMPFCYLLLDAAGTFLDIFYVDDAATSLLVNVTEDNIEYTANCAYELTFFLVSIFIFIFLKIKGEKLFVIDGKKDNQIWKISAAVFEVIGQSTYLFALSEGGGIAAVILGAGTVIVSFILSRIFLKEKLSVLQYIFIGILLSGIIILSF